MTRLLFPESLPEMGDLERNFGGVTGLNEACLAGAAFGTGGGFPWFLVTLFSTIGSTEGLTTFLEIGVVFAFFTEDLAGVTEAGAISVLCLFTGAYSSGVLESVLELFLGTIDSVVERFCPTVTFFCTGDFSLASFFSSF